MFSQLPVEPEGSFFPLGHEQVLDGPLDPVLASRTAASV